MASFGFVVCLQVNEYYNNTPCKGKSIHYNRFCPYRALCSQYSFTQGAALG